MCICEACLVGRWVTVWMETFCKSFLASHFFPAAFAFLSSTITFHLICQLNKYNKISFLEQNQF